MVDLSVMSSVNKYTPVRVQAPQTMSFGSHRQSDRPASAVRAGASTMPAAWQTRGVPSYDGATQHGATVRSFGDILLDPLRWAFSSNVHKAATGVVTCAVVATILF